MGVSPQDALREARSLGFGVGLDDDFQYMIKLFEKLLMTCKKEDDINNADIVSNTRDSGDKRDSYLYESTPVSFSPYLSDTKPYPYNQLNDQSPTRDNYDYELNLSDKKHDIPMVGIYDNSGGIKGSGFVDPVSGSFFD